MPLLNLVIRVPPSQLLELNAISCKTACLLMKEQERCRTCLSGHFHPTLNPKELKCNYCGWTRIAMNLGDYVTYGGKVDNIHNVNLEPKPPFRNEFITTVPPRSRNEVLWVP